MSNNKVIDLIFDYSSLWLDITNCYYNTTTVQCTRLDSGSLASSASESDHFSTNTSHTQ